MVFAKRQVRSLDPLYVKNLAFYLKSRSSVDGLIKENRKFNDAVSRFRPDLVHCHYGTITAFFTVISTPLPVIITFHGSDLNRTPSDGILRDLAGRTLSNFSVLGARKVICVSRLLAEKLWWQKKKAIVLPMGVDTDLFKPANQQQARNLLGWAEDEKVIIFNARDPKIKRLDIALETIEKLKKTIPGARLEILDGALDPSKVPAMLNAADCLLLCSETEGSPTIVKEAMACNLPVVSTDVGDVKERINGVKNCLVVPKKADSLAEALHAVIIKNERSDGRDRVAKDGLAEKDIAAQLLKIYEKILNRSLTDLHQ